MGWFKDQWNKKGNGFFKFIVVAGVVWLIVAVFTGENSLLKLFMAQMEVRRQERQIEQLKNNIDVLDKRLQMLSNDRDTLEEYARERFYFAEPGDDVYVLE